MSKRKVLQVRAVYVCSDGATWLALADGRYVRIRYVSPYYAQAYVQHEPDRPEHGHELKPADVYSIHQGSIAF